ncbi:hypothetical protein GCM10023331_16120 [Algivirga pacifica]|uniref:Type IX secretion system membrane protein, PorP/SprF family n=2 Tax=Algivirga pacifica TaxID=1162670 RepID=A0ABP9D660_9BACT
MFNQAFYNPAAVGLDSRSIDARALYRTQWLGYDADFSSGGAPTSQLLTVGLPLAKMNGGIGLSFLNDNLGAVNNQEIQLSFAYHISFGNSTLSLGARGGLFHYYLDYKKLTFVDDNDVINRENGSVSELVPDFAAGIYFDSPSLFLSASMNHLQQSTFSSGDGNIMTLRRHLTVMGGTNIDLVEGVTIQPSVIMKSDFNAYSFEGSVLAIINNSFYGGVNMREVEALTILAGANLTKSKNLTLGYAFDLTLQNKSAKSATSHELMLSYRFGMSDKTPPNTVRTPRFRF